GGQGPQAHLGLPLVRGQPVVAPVADLQRVVVVERAATAVWLPRGDLVEPGLHVGPVGERVAGPAGLAAVALDVTAGAPPVGVLGPGRGVGDGQAVGQLKVNRATGLRQRGGPGLHVRDVERADAVELDVVHAPRGELVGPGVDERLRPGLAVVDALHAAAVVVVLVHAVGDLIGGVGGALD